MRAGFIRPLGTGIFSYLHLAKRSMMKIEAILREEMNKIGGQEISMPVVQPADIWKETGRWYQIGSEMGRFKDKSEPRYGSRHDTRGSCHRPGAA